MKCSVSLYSFPKWECKECKNFDRCKDKFASLIIVWDERG